MKATPWIAESPFDGLFRRVPCAVDWAFQVEGELFREKDGRRTKRVQVEGGSYFVKTYGGPGVRELIKNWASLRGSSTSAAGEVRAHRAAEAAGVRVPRMVAAGSEGRRSFIVTEDVGTQDTVGSRLGELLTRGHRVRTALIDELGTLMGRLHGAGIHHRDCYLVHVALTGPPPTGTPLCLMDLHRAGVRRRIPLRWLAKDLGALLFSAEAAEPSRADLLRFERAYGQASALASGRAAGATGGAMSPALRRRTVARANSLRAEKARRGAHFGG